MNRFFITFIIVLVTSVTLHAAEVNTPHLYICGDSTAAKNKLPIIGWGEMMKDYLDTSHIQIENRARGGRSARTFITEGLWEAVHSQLKPGDIVIIQFGHNDGYSKISAARYDLPGIGEETQLIEDPKTKKPFILHTFGFYMRTMISEAKASGAKVIVLGSVPRCNWKDNHIVRDEAQHVTWARNVASQQSVLFWDDNDAIARVYDKLGADKTKKRYFPQDNTHTNPLGAKLNAAIITLGLATLNEPSLKSFITAEAIAKAKGVIESAEVLKD